MEIVLDRAKSICCHFTRNYAFYRAGEALCQRKGASQFWRLANGNFAEIAAIEFCKLFGGKKEKHRWQSIVKNQDSFIAALEYAIEAPLSEFEHYVEGIRDYRDQYLAHLDAVALVHFPSLDIAMKAVSVYYDHILKMDAPGGFPASLIHFYKQSLAEATMHYPPHP
jgi:hypothetical protein